MAQITTVVRRADTRPPVRLCIHHPPPYPHTGHHFRGTSSTFRSVGGPPCHANKSIVLMSLNQPGMLRQLSWIMLRSSASCTPPRPAPHRAGPDATRRVVCFPTTVHTLTILDRGGVARSTPRICLVPPLFILPATLSCPSRFPFFVEGAYCTACRALVR